MRARSTFRARHVVKGRELFDSLRVGMPVMHLVAKPAPEHMVSKRALRKWGKSNRRWATGTVHKVSPAEVVVKDVSSGKLASLTPKEVSNRLVVRES